MGASEASGFNIGPFGVPVDDERVYALEGSQGVLALDRADGSEVWSVDLTTTPTLGIDTQPVVVDGLVLVSTVPVSIGGIYTPGDRGVIHARHHHSSSRRASMARRFSRVQTAHRRSTPRSEDAEDQPGANPSSGAEAVVPHRAQVCSVSDT